jgi:hypothetical protein
MSAPEFDDINEKVVAGIAEQLMVRYGYQRDEWPLEWDLTDPYSQISAWTESTRDVITEMRKLPPELLETWISAMHGSLA